MTARIFVDTNIVLYTLGQDELKRHVARNILTLQPILSTQVINESINVCLRRFKFTKVQAYNFADKVMCRSNVRPIDELTVRKSAEIAMRYQFSNWDSLIIASALLNDCSILYSEDLQHMQHIESNLQIVNPFLIQSPSNL